MGHPGGRLRKAASTKVLSNGAGGGEACVETRSTDGNDGAPAAECVAAVVKRCTVRCVHNGGSRRWQRGQKKIGKTMFPQRTNPALTADVPHGEGNVLVFNNLNIET